MFPHWSLSNSTFLISSFSSELPHCSIMSNYRNYWVRESSKFIRNKYGIGNDPYLTGKRMWRNISWFLKCAHIAQEAFLEWVRVLETISKWVAWLSAKRLFFKISRAVDHTGAYFNCWSSSQIWQIEIIFWFYKFKFK